jgi:hypothetical protein
MKLMTYRSLGFPMGCSTDFSGEGIVGNHAYSILDIRELHEIQLGEQLSIRNFLRDQSSTLLSQPPQPSPSPLTSAPPASPAPSREEELLREVQLSGQLRLLRIRNPWGKREWNGNFSAHSSLWTTKLKQLLSSTSSSANASCSVDLQDGSFWITYTDFLRRFVTIDICKAHRPSHLSLSSAPIAVSTSAASSSSSSSSYSPSLSVSGSVGWRIHCLEDLIYNEQEQGQGQIQNTRSSFLLTMHDAPHSADFSPGCNSTYVSLLQESQRGASRRSSALYADLSALILRVPSAEVIGYVFSAPMRATCPLELSLPPGTYLIQVMSFSPPSSSSSLSPIPSSSSVSLKSQRRYWLHLYSAQPLHIQRLPSPFAPSPSPIPSLPFSLLHFLDTLSSSHSPSSPLTHLCSSSPLSLLRFDIFVLRGNGMNLLFCRSSSQSSASASALIDLSKENEEGESQDDWIELTALHRPSHLRIISPFLILPSSVPPQPPPLSLSPVQSYATSSFCCRGLQRNQLKILGIVLDTTGGSDSFEFQGELYLHTAALRIFRSHSHRLPNTSPERGPEPGQREQGRMIPFLFQTFDCK